MTAGRDMRENHHPLHHIIPEATSPDAVCRNGRLNGRSLSQENSNLSQHHGLCEKRAKSCSVNAVGVGNSYELCRAFEARDVCKRNLALRAVSLSSGSG